MQLAMTRFMEIAYAAAVLNSDDNDNAAADADDDDDENINPHIYAGVDNQLSPWVISKMGQPFG